MARLDSLTHIRDSALTLIDSLVSENTFEVLTARTQLGFLVDRFYEENKDFMAPQQYEAAKRDYEYFLALMELAIEHATSKMMKN